MKRITSLLVANRSEISIRVMRAAAEMSIRTVAIYSKEVVSACTASRPTRVTCLPILLHLMQNYASSLTVKMGFIK